MWPDREMDRHSILDCDYTTLKYMAADREERKKMANDLADLNTGVYAIFGIIILGIVLYGLAKGIF